MKFTHKDFVLVPEHAIAACRDRCNAALEMTDSKVRKMLVWAVHNGDPIGAQKGSDMLIHPPENAYQLDGLVLVLRITSDKSRQGGRFCVLKTVLTRDMAIANAEAVFDSTGRPS